MAIMPAFFVVLAINICTQFATVQSFPVGALLRNPLEVDRPVMVPPYQARYADTWPDAGLEDCWADAQAQSQCVLPRQEGVACLPGSPYEVSPVNRGWSMETRDQGATSKTCKPGIHCTYACQPGYEWLYFDQTQDAGYAWTYKDTRHGVLCGEDGTPQLDPARPMCIKYPPHVLVFEIDNQLDSALFACRTNYPGDERQVVPTKLPSRSRQVITPGAPTFWHGPQYKFTKPHYYLSQPGQDLMHACIWNYTTMDGSSHLPYQFSAAYYMPTGLRDASGALLPESFEPNVTWAADFNIFPNVFFQDRLEDVGYDVALACEHAPGYESACSPIMRFDDSLSGWVSSVSAMQPPDKENQVKLVLRITPKEGTSE